jgi:hypothetical protein
MSKNENLKKVLKKDLVLRVCDHNALKSEKCLEKSVTIKNIIFLKNNLGVKYVLYLYIK